MRAVAWLALASCTAAPLRASDCASCHADIAAEFAASRHSSAGQGEVYLAMLATVEAPQRAFCEGCHVRGREGERGLDCLTCHQAVGNEATQNGLLRSGPDGELGSAKLDPPHPTAHAVVARPFLNSAELCGTCHEVRGGGAFVETPFTEWQASPSAAAGETCQACHMRAGGKVSHRFDGVHGVEPSLLVGVADLSGRFADGGVELTMTSQLRGHSFPSGARFAREAWVEVRATDAAGAETTAAFPLSDLALAQGAPTFAPLLADSLEVRAVPALGSRTFALPLPDGAQAVTASLFFRPYSDGLLGTLALPQRVENPVTTLSAARF